MGGTGGICTRAAPMDCTPAGPTYLQPSGRAIFAAERQGRYAPRMPQPNDAAVIAAPPRRFALLFAAQFVAPGVLMPFLPTVLAGHGLGPTEIASILAAASAVRLLASPAVGRGADGIGDARFVLVLAAALATCTVTGYALGQGFAVLLVLAMLHSLVGAPVVPLSDALAVSAA